MPVLDIVTSSDRPDLVQQVTTTFRPLWPEFIFHDPVADEYRDRVGRYFPAFDLLILEGSEVVAGGWGIPVRWDGTVGDLPAGYDDALVRAVTGYEQAVPANTLCIMAAAVRLDRRGNGLSGVVLTALRERAAAARFEHVIAPVRPSLKSRYPLTPMDHFAAWTRGDGLHIDPWVRAHQRLGASILAAAPQSMRIVGTVAEWEAWTTMPFPETGSYVVPDALDLVEIDRDRDQGIYIESNLWMGHS
jgi:hypothetical protein